LPLIGEQRKLNSEALHICTLLFTKYCCHDVHIKEDGVGNTCSTLGEMRKECKILVRKREVKRSLGRPGGLDCDTIMEHN
jgi:hypothetical protein